MAGYADPFLAGRCPFCDGDQHRVMHRLADQYLAGNRLFSLLRCQGCQGAFLDGRTFLDLADYFAIAYPPSYHQGGGIVAHGPIPQLNGHSVDRIVSHRRPLECLDVGCGGGAFLAYMKRRGHQVTGFEPDPQAALNVSQRLQRPVHQGRLEETVFPGRYDLITLWDVLEHFVNPTHALEILSSHLKEGGRIVFGVPNFDAIEAKLLGASWFGLDLPRHTIQCGVHQLELLMTRAGLTLRRLTSLPRSSYFTKSFADARLFEARNRFSPGVLKGLQTLLMLIGNRGYLIGVAEPSGS